MSRYKSKKGISPLIASVLLIAFTMSVAIIFSPFATNTIKDVQEGTSQQQEDVLRSTNLGLEIMSVEFNRSSDNLSVTIQNTGAAIDSKTNISIGVIGGNVAKNKIHDVDLGKQEIATLDIHVEQTYPLETLQVDMTGYPVSRESGIKCTPTEGLIGYWTFNEEQTKNSWAIDLSEQKNNGSIGSLAKTGLDGKIGESYNLSNGQVDTSALNGANLSEFTVLFWSKVTSNSDDRLFIRKPWVDDGGFLGYISSPPTVVFASQSDTGKRVEGPKANLAYNEWMFHTYRFNGSAVSLWLNKKLKESQAQQSTFTASSGFNIGPGKSGQIDEVRIYNRSLSQQEIQRLYNVRSEDWAVSGCKLTG